MRWFIVATSLGLASAIPSTIAHAEIRGTLRIGIQPLSLSPSEDTPLFGSYVDDAVAGYNVAVAGYNHSHGLAADSAMAADPIDRDALGLRATLVTFAPGMEAGTENVYFRLQGELGVGSDHRSYGVGLYPLNLAVPIRNTQLIPYVSLGGSAGWLARTDTSDSIGGLFSARIAAGTRFSKLVIVEVGYSVFVLGGVVDHDRLESMASYDPRGAAPPPPPELAAQGGEQRGMIDVSAGVTF